MHHYWVIPQITFYTAEVRTVSWCVCNCLQINNKKQFWLNICVNIDHQSSNDCGRTAFWFLLQPFWIYHLFQNRDDWMKYIISAIQNYNVQDIIGKDVVMLLCFFFVIFNMCRLVCNTHGDHAQLQQCRKCFDMLLCIFKTTVWNDGGTIELDVFISFWP